MDGNNISGKALRFLNENLLTGENKKPCTYCSYRVKKFKKRD
jgi:hypothetical protein